MKAQAVAPAPVPVAMMVMLVVPAVETVKVAMEVSSPL